MASSSNGGVTAYAGLVVVMIIAVAALAAFKLNLGGINEMLFNEEPINRPTQPRDHLPHGGTGTQPEEYTFPAKPPERPDYFINHANELPKELTVAHKVGDYEVEVQLCLVPQGWFIMGDNDGITANGPKHWVWLDDYYIGKFEFTNEQYYAFILANGYQDAEWWTQEGISFIRSQAMNRGTEYLGWVALDQRRRLWGLASPDNDVVLEAQNTNGFGQPNTTTLILHDGGTWSESLNIDRDNGKVYVRIRDDWKEVSGKDIRQFATSGDTFGWVKSGILHFTDKDGRIDFADVPKSDSYTIVSWVDGDDEIPAIGRILRTASDRMRNPDMPVVGLSWFEADACARFFGGDLPTEAQWEKAGRGVDGRAYPWGDDLEMNRQMATRMGKRYVTDRANMNRWQVEPVGSFPAGESQYGVHDLVGNAAEWCRDVFIAVPKWGERNPVNRGGAQDRRSLRGTHTDEDDPQTAKLHHRRDSDPYDRRAQYKRGFRIVMQPKVALEKARK